MGNTQKPTPVWISSIIAPQRLEELKVEPNKHDPKNLPTTVTPEPKTPHDKLIWEIQNAELLLTATSLNYHTIEDKLYQISNNIHTIYNTIPPTKQAKVIDQINTITKLSITYETVTPSSENRWFDTLFNLNTHNWQQELFDKLEKALYELQTDDITTEEIETFKTLVIELQHHIYQELNHPTNRKNILYASQRIDNIFNLPIDQLSFETVKETMLADALDFTFIHQRDNYKWYQLDQFVEAIENIWKKNSNQLRKEMRTCEQQFKTRYNEYLEYNEHEKPYIDYWLNKYLKITSDDLGKDILYNNWNARVKRRIKRLNPFEKYGQKQQSIYTSLWFSTPIILTTITGIATIFGALDFLIGGRK